MGNHDPDRCPDCGCFLAHVPVIWKTEKYGDIEAINYECHNPKCPTTTSRNNQEKRS